MMFPNVWKQKDGRTYIQIDLDSPTIWQLYSDNVLGSELTDKAKNDFMRCSKGYTLPVLVVHAGSGPAGILESLRKGNDEN